MPVIAWVTPGGARAASAGVFIVMAADVAAMAPGTNIGAATPDQPAGPDGLDAGAQGHQRRGGVRAHRRRAARPQRGVGGATRCARRWRRARPRRWSCGVVDFVAGDARRAAREGRRPHVAARRRDAHAGARGPAGRRASSPGFRQRLLGAARGPERRLHAACMLGFYGLLFELQNPGAILPGVVGGICLILAFLALSTLPVNYAGRRAASCSRVAFFLAEIKVASHGLLAAGGVISLRARLADPVPGRGRRACRGR